MTQRKFARTIKHWKWLALIQSYNISKSQKRRYITLKLTYTLLSSGYCDCTPLCRPTRVSWDVASIVLLSHKDYAEIWSSISFFPCGKLRLSFLISSAFSGAILFGIKSIVVSKGFWLGFPKKVRRAPQKNCFSSLYQTTKQTKLVVPAFKIDTQHQ